MPQSVKLSDELIKQARHYGDVYHRSTAKQIEYWSTIGKISEDPDTIVVLCDHVKGLGIALDPSHFHYGTNAGRSYDRLLKYVYHVYLRDTNAENFQVRVGQGDIEYGRLVNMLTQVKYNRALSIDIQPMPEVDQMAEMRKMRLLLDSML